MKTMKIWRLVLATLAAFSLASCSSESKDGDWDPMVWKAEVPVQTTDKVYNVSEDGETIIFSCLNYSKPWFSEAEVDGEPILPPYMDEIGYGLIYGENFRAEIHGNKLSIEFKPNKTAQTTNTSITVTAGDIFYTSTTSPPNTSASTENSTPRLLLTKVGATSPNLSVSPIYPKISSAR